MKKTINTIVLIIIFTGIWLILNESIQPLQIFLGIIISIISILITNHYFLKNSYAQTFFMKPFVVLNYSIYVIFQIYKSGFYAIKKIITGRDCVKIIDYDTCISDDFAICLLANAITLTPGTVTINKKENHLQILCFEDESEFTDITDATVCSKYEKILWRIGL
jgi:multicomponent Na+:H+ antiporter subunit E